jgi:hypothetical protein
MITIGSTGNSAVEIRRKVLSLSKSIGKSGILSAENLKFWTRIKLNTKARSFTFGKKIQSGKEFGMLGMFFFEDGTINDLSYNTISLIDDGEYQSGVMSSTLAKEIKTGDPQEAFKLFVCDAMLNKDLKRIVL